MSIDRLGVIGLMDLCESDGDVKEVGRFGNMIGYIVDEMKVNELMLFASHQAERRACLGRVGRCCLCLRSGRWGRRGGRPEQDCQTFFV